jgi:hypothetical protein
MILALAHKKQNTDNGRNVHREKVKVYKMRFTTQDEQGPRKGKEETRDVGLLQVVE